MWVYTGSCTFEYLWIPKGLCADTSRFMFGYRYMHVKLPVGLWMSNALWSRITWGNLYNTSSWNTVLKLGLFITEVLLCFNKIIPQRSPWFWRRQVARAVSSYRISSGTLTMAAVQGYLLKPVCWNLMRSMQKADGVAWPAIKFITTTYMHFEASR
jgi:hypothetical protein